MAPDAATYVVRRNIFPGHERDYDDWLRRFIAEERTAPGYLGTTVISPGGSSTVRYIIHRFETSDSMNAWESSPHRLQMLEEAQKYSTPHFEKASGVETWFTLPDSLGMIAPPKWKMALVLLAGATLISVIVRYAIGGYLASLPIPLAALVMSAILVAGLTWLVMPNFTRWLRGWLYPTAVPAPVGPTP